MKDYIPRRDNQLVSWNANFANQIGLDPARYGLTLLQAETFRTDALAFEEAFQRTCGNDTKSPLATRLKNEARATVVAQARMLARIVQANPDVSAQDRYGLGLHVRATETPIDALPQTPPALRIRGNLHGEVEMELRNLETPSTAARPRGCAGAAIFSACGTNPPRDPRDWRFECNVTRTRFVIPLPANQPPGTVVWYYAAWIDAALQLGPPSPPRETHVQFGTTMRLHSDRAA